VQGAIASKHQKTEILAQRGGDFSEGLTQGWGRGKGARSQELSPRQVSTSNKEDEEDRKSKFTPTLAGKNKRKGLLKRDVLYDTRRIEVNQVRVLKKR